MILAMIDLGRPGIITGSDICTDGIARSMGKLPGD
jgi:hypothetical protein